MTDFQPPTIEGTTVDLFIETTPGIFHEMEDQSFVLFFKPFKGQATVGQPLTLAGMFQAWWLLQDGKKVGMMFRTHFQVLNEGGFIVAFMNKARGRAVATDVVSKTEELVIYNYPNRGTLITTPKTSAAVATIFEEQ